MQSHLMVPEWELRNAEQVLEVEAGNPAQAVSWPKVLSWEGPSTGSVPMLLLKFVLRLTSSSHGCL